jgi:hypothetical protein
MSEIERRAYTENVVAQEAAYWYCREHGIRVDDLDIGQILQVAAPIILATENEKLRRLLWRIAKGEPWSDVAVEVYDAAGADPGAIPPGRKSRRCARSAIRRYVLPRRYIAPSSSRLGMVKP